MGHYVLGVSVDKETETNVLLIEHDIPCDQFSDEVMRCLPGDHRGEFHGPSYPVTVSLSWWCRRSRHETPKKKNAENEKDFERRQLLSSGIKTLNTIATGLAKRIEAGFLALVAPEVQLVLDSETQKQGRVDVHTA